MTSEDRIAMMREHAESVMALPKPEPIDNLTSLPYWFRRIEAAGLPVPRTTIVEATEAETAALWKSFDGEAADFSTLGERIVDAARPFGVPFFLRTDLTSAKHDWEKSCYVSDPSKILSHVYAIAEFSAIADLFGPDFTIWVVRELLPTTPLFTAFWGRMPIVREFRFFVRDGIVEHIQPYWPPGAIEDHAPSVDDWRKRLIVASRLTDDERTRLAELALRASAAVPGFWSVDLLETSNGDWFLTDMAEGNKSFRWDGATT